MTKYTQEQLLEMTNEQRDEVVALAQGWAKRLYTPPNSDVVGDWEVWHTNEDNHIVAVRSYHPSINKEQAWDLMVILLKTGFLVEHDDGTFGVKRYDYSFLGSTDNKDPLIAVVIASILHLQESE